MATQVNIFADQGSDYSLDVTVKEDDGTATDLTSFTLSAKFTKNYGTAQTYNFTTQVIDAANGTLKLKLPAETSNSVAYGRYVYDMTVDSVLLDKTRRVVEGILTIRPKV
tara:strand:+ start:203 stop:532 length:330 start_codon:yes stop_codon:yes gene_type:complete